MVWDFQIEGILLNVGTIFIQHIYLFAYGLKLRVLEFVEQPSSFQKVLDIGTILLFEDQVFNQQFLLIFVFNLPIEKFAMN